MRLYGSPTSPFVRRVRVLLFELGLETTLVNTLLPEGQAALREVTPIWKVPVLEVDGQLIFDSHVIVDWLLREYGHRGFREASPRHRVHESNLCSVMDTALEAAINLRYLHANGAEPDHFEYLAKHRDRVAAAMQWLDAKLTGPWVTEEPRLGVSELTLVTGLDWFVFRDAYPVSAHPRLAAFREAHAAHPSLTATAPGPSF